jgi:hypothetical protein
MVLTLYCVRGLIILDSLCRVIRHSPLSGTRLRIWGYSPESCRLWQFVPERRQLDGRKEQTKVTLSGLLGAWPSAKQEFADRPTASFECYVRRQGRLGA